MSPTQPAPPYSSAPLRGLGLTLGLDGVAYGGDYNPEQWPESVWAEDVRLMREAGVNLVSIGIFSWALLEPREGEFDFAWLDRLITLLHDNGVHVDLGTPTASPPAWFFHTYPQARVVTRSGTVLGFGSRGMAAPTSPEYRSAAVRITTELARRYGSHPAVVLWHVHNEYGAPVSEDYSANAEPAFRRWLLDRHGSLAGLNAAWGTTFWGQHYDEWEHVGLPAAAPTVVNPAQRLDFARFSDAMLRECFVAERDAIREYSDAPVTTNFMAGTCPSTDLWAWAREVDIVSNDHYLTAADRHPEIGLALSADLTRSLAGGRPWLLMEHSTSAVSWQEMNVAKRPGEMARNALSHLGRGADGILFFQWRASRFGAEKFHSAMVPHAGTRSRVWREVCDLGRTLERLRPVLGSRVTAEAAILWDWESFWAQDLEWRPSGGLSHRAQVDAWYTRLWTDGITTDFAHPETDLTAYRLVVAPASYLLTRAGAANLSRYVEGGGTLLVACFSGIVDENDAVHEGGYFAPLRETLGLTVEEFLPLRHGDVTRVDWQVNGERTELRGTVWSDDITLEGADVIARFLDGPAAGLPAVTRNQHGAGTAWYVSAVLTTEALGAVAAPVYADAGMSPRQRDEGLEVVVRRNEDAEYVVALNHSDSPAALPVEGLDLLTGVAADGLLKLAPGGAAVVQRDARRGQDGHGDARQDRDG